MRRSKRFVFDMDDTVVDFFPAMCELAQQHYPSSNPRSWTQRASHVYLGITLEAWLDKLIHGRILETAPAKGNIDIIRELVDAGHNVHFVTNRGFHPQAKEVTASWLHSNLGIDADVHILPIWDCKADYIKKIFGKVDCFFDDTIEHCTNVLEKGVSTECYVMEMPWSRFAQEPFIKLNTLEEFRSLNCRSQLWR